MSLHSPMFRTVRHTHIRKTRVVYFKKFNSSLGRQGPWVKIWGGIEVDKTILKYDITLSHTPHSHGMTVSFVIDVIE